MKETQQQKVLRLLKQAGVVGVNSYTFTFQERVKQIATRVFELKKEGYNIASRILPNRSVQYILINGSLSLMPRNSRPPIPQPSKPWDDEDELVPVRKTINVLGKERIVTTWEKPENVRPIQEVLSL